jgi:DNA-directed RNA polymerase beta subunit
MFVELAFETKLKVGDKFKKNEVIAAEKRAFTKNEDNIGASMNIGVLAKVAITSIDDILEDSEPMTKKLSEQLAYYAIVKKTKALPANAKVDRMVKIGDHVNIGDPLIIFDNHNGDEEVAKFLEEYSKALNENDMQEALVESNSTSLKATDSGEIIDIKMYYTVDINELSPSLQKIVKAYNQKIDKKNKFLDKYKNENDNNFYKCGQLLTETSEKSETFYGKVKGEDVGDGILIEFYIKHKDIIKKGDKTTNFCALKGVVSHVIEEGQEPWSEFRPEEEVSAFISPLSILARKTPSVYTNLFGNKVLIELKRKVIKDYFG